MKAGCALLLGLWVLAGVAKVAAFPPPPRLENDVLRIELSLSDAGISVFDKRDQVTWRQEVLPGFRVTPETLRISPGSIACRVTGPDESTSLTIALSGGSAPGFDLTIEHPPERYATLPRYPFHFKAPGTGWFYVQNTSGEGMLMPLDQVAEINKPYGWSGGQPWWGLTDLTRGLAVRLNTFRNPDSRSKRPDATVYALPIRITCTFFTTGGYVALAKDYRDYFLHSHPELRALRDRVGQRPAVGVLKDGVYVYLWGDSPADDLQLVREMKAAGVERGFAVFYGKHPIDRALFDGIKGLGWVPGLYQMPTGNLFRVARGGGWPDAVLTRKISAEQLLRKSAGRGWDRICGRYQLPRWLEKAKELIRNYGPQLFYFDTLAIQLAPCLSPSHPSTIEENLQARLEIMEKTRDLGTVVGTGEGISPTWALPGVDFFEGLMSLRTYADPRLKIPSGGYETDLGESYRDSAAFTLDETRRIPLYQLAFHDYVAGTWVWRDTNFQSRPFAWKKDLFNILYGTMPMWHINRKLWEAHQAEYVASYRAIASVRSRIGFAGMLNHGWLAPDRSVQFTDWDTGDRVIVNFGDKPFLREGRPTVAGKSFLMEKTEVR